MIDQNDRKLTLESIARCMDCMSADLHQSAGDHLHSKAASLVYYDVSPRFQLRVTYLLEYDDLIWLFRIGSDLILQRLWLFSLDMFKYLVDD